MPDEVVAAPVAPNPTPTPVESAAPAATPQDSSSTTPTPSTTTEVASPSPSTATSEKTEAKPEPTLLEAATAKVEKSEAKTETKTETTEIKADAAPEKADAKDAKPETKPDDKKSNAKSEPAPEKSDPAKEATTAEKPPVKYEAFKVPDGVKLDEERIKPLVEVLGSHQVPQEQAQKLVDLHLAEMTKYHEQVQKEQRDVWQKLNNTWKAETRKELGNHHDTDLALAKAVLEEYGGTPEQVRELLAHTANNGMGNYIGLIRTLRNIGRALNVFEDSVVPAQSSAPKPAKSPGNRGWYDKLDGASA